MSLLGENCNCPPPANPISTASTLSVIDRPRLHFMQRGKKEGTPFVFVNALC